MKIKWEFIRNIYSLPKINFSSPPFSNSIYEVKLSKQIQTWQVKIANLMNWKTKATFSFLFFFWGGGVGQKTKDELSSLFCETPSSWGDYQNTPCSGFAKGLRFLNIVMTFILHPLYHYNSITEPRAWFFVFALRRHFYWLPFSFYSIPYRCL